MADEFEVDIDQGCRGNACVFIEWDRTERPATLRVKNNHEKQSIAIVARWNKGQGSEVDHPKEGNRVFAGEVRTFNPPPGPWYRCTGFKATLIAPGD